MRFRNLLFGIAVSAIAVNSICNTGWSQEEGRRGPPGGGDRGGRGGPPGGGFGGRSGGIQGLLRMEEVQQELKLTDQQKADLIALGEKQREAFSAFRPDGGRPSVGRPGTGRPEGGAPDGPRPEGGRPDGGRGPGGPGGPGGMPNMNSDQMRELMAKVNEARDKAEAEILSSILDPDQGDRILGLLIQLEDGRALMSNPLAEAIGLTADQKQQLKTVTENARAEMMKMFESFRNSGGPSQDSLTQREAMEKKVNSDLLAVMTADQKAKFEAMKGDKFTFPEPRSFGFGGPGGGNRGRGGPPGEGGQPPREGGRPGRPEGPTNN